MVKNVESQQKKISDKTPKESWRKQRPAELPGRGSKQPEPPGKDTFQPVELLQAMPYTLPTLVNCHPRCLGFGDVAVFESYLLL